jgi:CheY-like chemotaxis protein
VPGVPQSAGGTGASGASTNVLVVDDDRTTRFLLSRALSKRFGCQVTEACDGEQALDALYRSDYQLAILDVQMPVIDGLQMLRHLRESPALRALPVVMLTGTSDDSVVKEVIELGVLEYMTKPLNIPRLSERIRRILRAVGSDRGGPAAGRLRAKALADPEAPALIIEGRSAFRSFFVETLGATRPVAQAESGVRGFRDCLTATPAVVFIGTDLGVLGEPLLVRKIRSLPAISHLPLVRLVDDDAEADLNLATYDETFRRSLSWDGLFREIQEVARRAHGAGLEIPGVHGGFRAGLMFVGERVFGATLSTEVMSLDLPQPVSVERIVVSARGVGERHDAEEPAVQALTLQVACDLGTARRAATNLFGLDARIVRDEDAVAATLKVFDLLVRRLREIYEDTGQTFTFDAPGHTKSAQAMPDPEALETGLGFFFQPAIGDQGFWLTARPVAEPGAGVRT